MNFSKSPPLYMFYNLPVYYLDFFQYYFFEDVAIYYEVMKTAVSFLSGYLFYVFARDYVNRQAAFLLAVFFILFPLHDSVNYLLQNAQYLLIAFGLIVYSHALINNNSLKKGFLMGMLGSFFSYASPPFVWGLSVIFLMKKEYKKFLIFTAPQVIYTLYILIAVKVFTLEKVRTIDSGNFSKLIKQFILQVLTFIDVAIGPSLAVKIYFSILQLSFLSVAIGILIIVLFYKYYGFEKEKFNFHLFCAFSVVTVLAFCMFAVTGYYPQTAFNLGNRVTIYSSLLLAFLAGSFISSNKKAAVIIFSILIFSILGISDHWKDWNKKQKLIADNFAGNRDIISLDASEPLFVSYNQFSKFGEISHIEFITEGVGGHLLKRAAKKDFKISPINKRFYVDNNVLIDRKWEIKFIVKDYINVYDSESDKLLKIEKNKIQNYIDSLPNDNRHWAQLIDNKFINGVIVKLMPRLKYAF
ncbi:MAG: hypothetical protein HZA10_05940 [Nitrospirae bacterium]|nr:hypothetical protein [Nitrospirota bacterium]